MAILLCIMLGIIFFFQWKRKAKWYSPMVLMSALWFCIIFGSQLCLYNMNATSDRTYGIVGLGLLFYFIGCGFTKRYYIQEYSDTSKQMLLESFDFNYKAILILCVICIAVLWKRVVLVTGLYAAGFTLDQIRINFAELVIQDGFTGLLDNFVVHPVIFLLMPVAIVGYMLKGSRNKIGKIVLVLSFIIILLYAYCDGGRAIFMLILFYYFLANSFVSVGYGEQNNKKFKKIITIAVLVTIVFSIINYLSDQRNTTMSADQSFYSYLCGCMPHLDLRLSQLDLSGYNSYGLSFLRGPIESLLFFLKNLHLIGQYPDWFVANKTQLDVSEFVDIGSQNYNAFVTPFYYFYADFGYIGVALESLVFGAISQKLFDNAETGRSSRYVIMYMLFAYCLIMSMVRWQFFNVTYFISFFYILLFIKSKK